MKPFILTAIEASALFTSFLKEYKIRSWHVVNESIENISPIDLEGDTTPGLLLKLYWHGSPKVNHERSYRSPGPLDSKIVLVNVPIHVNEDKPFPVYTYEIVEQGGGVYTPSWLILKYKYTNSIVLNKKHTGYEFFTIRGFFLDFLLSTLQFIQHPFRAV